MSWKEAFRKQTSEPSDSNKADQAAKIIASTEANLSTVGSTGRFTGAIPETDAEYANYAGIGTPTTPTTPETPDLQALWSTIESLEKWVHNLENRVDVLERPYLRPAQNNALPSFNYPSPGPAAPPPVNVVPPTGALIPKGVSYADDICDTCGRVHDGTGRYMDARGKLTKDQNHRTCL